MGFYLQFLFKLSPVVVIYVFGLYSITSNLPIQGNFLLFFLFCLSIIRVWYLFEILAKMKNTSLKPTAPNMIFELESLKFN